jgi:hypothetical protein
MEDQTMTQTTAEQKSDPRGSRARPEDAPRPATATKAARTEETDETKAEAARPAAYRDWASI